MIPQASTVAPSGEAESETISPKPLPLNPYSITELSCNPGKGARNQKQEPPTALGGFLIMKEKKEERKLEARDGKAVNNPQRVYRLLG